MNETKYDLSFEDIELICGNKKVVWEWIGEGWDGDYNEEDKDDVPLLRFTCYETEYPTDLDMCNEWLQMDDASYCTRMPIDSNKSDLIKALGIIMEAIQDCNYKRRLEELSWFCPEDFNKKG